MVSMQKVCQMVERRKNGSNFAGFRTVTLFAMLAASEILPILV